MGDVISTGDLDGFDLPERMLASQVEIRYSSELDQRTKDDLAPKMRQVAAQLEKWVNNARAVTNRSSMFDRAAYTPSENIYDQMRMSRKAVGSDDVVGGTAEVTEGLAFDGVNWESANNDEADIFNQMAAEQDLDALVRKMHREEFTYSQCVLAFWWDEGSFKVRGTTPSKGGTKGAKRKKVYDVWYPRAITVLDSCKVVPVGMMQFGQERLAWQGTQVEIAQYNQVLDGNLEDELMVRFYAGQYVPSDIDEITELSRMGVDIGRLILLNDAIVKRHTLTKPDHERFADLRMKRVFRLLDLKQQLMESDRVTLIGAANYILLVKKGDDKDPAYPEEIQNLKENFNYIAKLPVIVSDHRLNIEIVAPKTDFTLNPDKYDLIDNRIAATMLGLFGAMGSRSGNRGDTSLQQARLVARTLENRRHMIRRFLEREIAKAVVEHPKNAGQFDAIDEPPALTFVPKNVQLDSDQGMAQAILGIRNTGDLSRQSMLEYFGFDQQIEAMRRTLEDESGMDDTFKTAVPFSSPAGGAPVGGGPAAPAKKAAAAAPAKKAAAPPAAQRGAGASGGRPAGGGTPSKNATKAVARTAKGTTKPSGS